MKRLRSLGLPVLIVFVLFVFVTVFFLFEFLNYRAPEATVEAISAESYAGEVAALLANADATRAEAALNSYGCVACHRAGAANGVAPAFVGMAEVAASRRPPMSAAAYIYESIVHPGDYIVEGYADVMPHDLGTRISQQDLGDMIAYLLTEDAQ